MLFGNPNIRYFNELEINGENVDDDDDEDFTKDEPDLDEEETEEDTGDDLDDFTEDEFDEDEEPAEDDTDEEPIEDYTEDVPEDEGDDTEGENPEETEDTEGATEDEGDDDLTDFTQDDFDAEDDTDEPAENTDEGGEESEVEQTDDGDTEGDASGESESNDTENTLAGMEKNLFSDLSPQQMAIKNNELLQNYIELYETVSTIFDSINKIPKTINNTRPLTFIADQLVELKDMVNYVITTTYVTRTYVENMAYYKQALVVLEQLNTMLKALIQKPAK